MKEALDGGRYDPGGIMKFPDSSIIDEWKNAEKCKDNRGDLLPYFFDPNSNIMNETVIRTLLGENMIGIDNMEKWKEVMGLKIMRINMWGYDVTRIDSPFIRQVKQTTHECYLL